MARRVLDNVGWSRVRSCRLNPKTSRKLSHSHTR